jgi:hypothetical protein
MLWEVTDVPDSKVIRQIRYCEADERMIVRFPDGDEYLYDRVPQDVHGAFIAAKSRGQFFGRYIRPYFEGVKLT